jgi:hypothetical protein
MADKKDVEIVADALDGIASALRRLGTAEASTHLGAIESLTMGIEKGLLAIAGAISELACGVERLADAKDVANEIAQEKEG